MYNKKTGFIIYTFMWSVLLFSLFSPVPEGICTQQTSEAPMSSVCTSRPASEDVFIITTSGGKTEKQPEAFHPLTLTAYIVQENDTAESIAELFGISTATVIGSNNAAALAELTPGTVLRIPDRDGFFVYVNEFDTLELFSQAYRCDKSDIIKVNALASTNLDGISELFIPGAEPVAVIETELYGERAFSSVGEGGAGAFYSDALIYPLAAEISSRFGTRSDPFTGNIRNHNGIDLPADEGTTILASGSGRVIFADEMRGYGTTLVIDNGGGFTTLYAHCSELLVTADDFVKRGQPVALSGSTGRATGPHLHFEIRHNNIPVDPEFYLQK